MKAVPTIRHEQFPSSYVPPRHVDVWLPPGHQQDGKTRFPVLYMHDGQNLFDPATSTHHITWGVAEAATRLIAEKVIPPIIIVGIWNCQRYAEYLPQRPFTGGVPAEHRAWLESDPRADRYLRFLVEELKPFIDAHYPTKPGADDTAVMGSSMGGLISLYALCEYPQTFHKAGCVSTHWPAVENVILPYLEKALPPAGTHRLYFDYGTESLDAAYEPMQTAVDHLMQQKGYTPHKDWLTRKFEGATHNEAAWRQRVHIPLTFLFANAAQPG